MYGQPKKQRHLKGIGRGWTKAKKRNQLDAGITQWLKTMKQVRRKLHKKPHKQMVLCLPKCNSAARWKIVELHFLLVLTADRTNTNHLTTATNTLPPTTTTAATTTLQLQQKLQHRMVATDRSAMALPGGKL